MSHAELTAEEQLAAGIKQGLIRLAIGIEDVTDLIEDLAQALDQAELVTIKGSVEDDQTTAIN